MARLRLPRFLPALLLLLVSTGSPASGPEVSLPQALQQAVEKSMAGRTGAAVVVEVVSGRVLAQFRLDLAGGTLARPGSAIKPFTLETLFERGTVGPSTTLQCERRVRIGGRRLECTHARTSEPLDAVSALAYSCNYFFAHFARELDETELTQTLLRAGLASRTGLVAEEAAGLVQPPATPEQRQLQALGESNVEVTPLELLLAYRKLALARRETQKPAGARAAVFAGLEASVVYGTAQRAGTPGLNVAGKTGTATVPGSPWTNAWFVGYAPADRPEIVLVVFLEQGRGGADAAPIAGEVFRAYRVARVPQ